MLNRLLRPLLLMVVSLGGCMAHVGVSGGLTIPPDAGNVCTQQCGTIGMNLSAVAIMANNVGCICQPRVGTPPVASQGASTAAGMATIEMLNAGQQERQREQQQAQQSQQPPQQQP